MHDQITIRICHEYFTVFHAKIFPTKNHTLIALGWGVVATWWVGLPLGVMVAIAARIGSRPKLGAMRMVRPLVRTCVIVGCVAAIAGVVAWVALRGITLPSPMFDSVARDRHGRLATCWVIHNTSYWGGAIAGVVLAVVTYRGRKTIDSAECRATVPQVRGS